MAFNKNAKDELINRLTKIGVEGVDVNTFHSFGYRIIGQVTEKKPDVYKVREKFIQKELNKICDTNSNLLRKLVYYFAFYLNEHKAPEKFNNLDEYLKYNKAGGLKTLDGKYVKSLQEVHIANYLYLKCIKYKYEEKYTHDTATKDYRQYKPDFYLTDYDIWLEHFAMKRDSSGNYHSIFDGYMDGYNWKINLHKKYGTRLISTFSYQFDDGSIDSVLEKTLKDEAVLFGERTNNEIIADLKNHNKVTISKFSDLLSEFISLCKSSQNNPVNLLDKQSNLNNDRNVAFLEILNPIYDAYQKELEDNETIDFDDMIADSCQNLKENINLKSKLE